MFRCQQGRVAMGLCTSVVVDSTLTRRHPPRPQHAYNSSGRISSSAREWEREVGEEDTHGQHYLCHVTSNARLEIRQ
jgi:hypothetical protein